MLEPRSALAYERSELIRDESAARVATLARWRSGRARILVASVQALLQPTIAAGGPARPPARASPRRPDPPGRAAGRAPPPRLRARPRGGGARRDGPSRRPRRPLPGRRRPPGPDRALRGRDRRDPALRSHGPADRPPGRGGGAPAGHRVPRPRRRGSGRSAPASARSPSRLPERLAADLARLEGAGEAAAPPPPAASPSAAPPGARALDVGDAAEVWSAVVCPASGLDHLGSDTLLVVDEPGEVAAAAEFLWEQAAERRRDLVAAGELPGAWPSAYVEPRAWKARLLGARTLELTWESGPVEAIDGAPALDDPFGWREPVLPPGRSAGLARAIERWRAADPVPGIVLASDQAARLAELLGEAGIPAGVTMAPGAPPPGAVALVGRSLNAGFGGGPDGLVLVTDRELFGTVRVRRPKALRRVVPRDILERLSPGDLVVHIDHGIARYEQMLRRGGAGEERDYLELVVRRRRPHLRARGADRAGEPLRGRRASVPLPPRWRRVEPDQDPGPEGRRRPRRRPPAPLRGAGRGGGPRLRPGHPVAAGAGGFVPVRGDARPAAGDRRGQGRHGVGPPDGPDRRGRRRVREDGGRPAGGVQGDPGRPAGRGPRPDHRPRRPARPDLRPALRGVPGDRPPPLPGGVGEGAGGDPGRPRRRLGGRRGRDASPPLEGRPLSRPRACSSSTRSSASGSPPRSASSSSAPRSTS